MLNLFTFFEMSEIVSYHIDFLHNEFTLEVNNSQMGYQKAIFKGVSTFYFIHDQTEKRKNFFPPEQNKVLETSDVGILDNTLEINLNSKSVDWAHDYSGSGNVFIEIWEQLIILEAQIVSINGVDYNL